MSDTPGTAESCPLCRSNGLLKEEVIARSAGAYLIKAHSSPENFLIVPEIHTEFLLELPDDWWQAVKPLLAKVPNLGEDYNVSVNVGHRAGQTVKHLHFWVIPRSGNKPSSHKGLARLLAEADGV